MNAAKRTARAYKLGKIFGKEVGKRLSDNRSFRKQDALGNYSNNLSDRDSLICQLLAGKRRQRAEQTAYIVEHRNAVNLNVPSGVYIGFHEDLYGLTDGQITDRYELLKRLVETRDHGSK